jgi:hypothetical protein
LPGVAAIEQQRTGTGGAHLVDQGLQMGETAYLAVGLRGGLEIQIGKGMGVDRSRLDAVVFQEVLADQVRHLALGSADTEIDIRLAEPDRLELRMGVGDVHQ